MVVIMELKKYKNNNTRKSYVLIAISFLLISISTYLFYKSYALYEENKNFNVINGTVEDPGDIYFAYYVDNVISTSVPSKTSGYYLTEKSSCTDGVTVSWNLEDWIANLDFSSYKKADNSRVKCTLYFSSVKYDDSTIYDLSGNHYDGTFQNGAKIVTDSSGQKAISFDGIDDYVDIKDIPNIYDWNNGYTVFFEVIWYSFNDWSRIFDFSSNKNENVILFANAETTNNVTSGGRNGKDDSDHVVDATFKNKLILSKKQSIKLKRIKTDFSSNLCDVVLFMNDQFNEAIESAPCNSNSDYINNYLGKSAWARDSYFHGLIYNFKIIDAQNNIVVWYDLNL